MHGFGRGADVGAARDQLLHLLEPRLDLRGACPGDVHLVVQFGQLLLVHEPAVRADNVVLGLVALDLFLGAANPLLQFLTDATSASRWLGA